MANPTKLELQQQLNQLKKDYDCLESRCRILAKMVATNAIIQGQVSGVRLTESERDMIENVRQVLNSIFEWI